MATRVTSEDELQAAAGAVAELVGRYGQLDVRMRQKGDPVYLGHVALTLADGTLVTLEPIWSDAARRPAEEIERWDGQEVVVRGLLHAEAPEPPEPQATIVSPCVSPVEAIEAQAG
jgi:hypothetical protein